MPTPSLLSLSSMVGQILTVTQIASAATPTTVYTVPSNDSVKIAGGAVTNPTGAGVTVSLSVVPSGGTASAANQVISVYPLAAGDTLSLKDYLGGVFIGDGDSISVTCSAAAAVVVWLSGIVSGSTNAGVGTSLVPTTVKTTAYTAVSTDLVRVSTAGGAVPVTLPAAAAGTVIGVKLVAQTSANAVTVTPTGADTIDGAASLIISTLGDMRTLLGFAGGWIVANGLVAAGAPNATTTTAGLVQLAGDLGGTALAPTVPGKRALLFPTAVKTSAYTAAAKDLVLCDPSGGSFSVTLPSAPTDKTEIAIKLVTAPGANSVTVVTSGADKFNTATGATTATLALLGHSMVMQYQSSTGLWFTLSNDLPLSQIDLRYLNNSLATTKGDLVAATAAGTLTRVGVGAAGQLLIADPTPAAGLRWATLALGARGDGQENFPRWAAQGSIALTSGFVRFAFFVANKSETITKLSFTSGSTAAGATPTLVRYALYSVDGSGNLTQLANIASDTTIFAVTLTPYARTLNTPVALTDGQLYAAAVIIVTAAAAPTLQGGSFASGADNAVSPRLSGIFTGQTDLLASYTAAQVSQTVAAPYVAILR